MRIGLFFFINRFVRVVATNLLSNKLQKFFCRANVRYSSMSLSPTLGRNEKTEQYIRKKTQKLNVLMF